MKGVVFTEFVEFVENKFGFDVVDEMIANSNTSTNGIFTQAGNYPFSDMLCMVQALSGITNIPLGGLVEAYGRHLFHILVVIYPEPIKHHKTTFDFIKSVEKAVHPEVKKLYPDTELPSFELLEETTNILKIRYHSSKPLMDFAKGLMLGCADFYNENLEVAYEVIHGGEYFEADFTISKV